MSYHLLLLCQFQRLGCVLLLSLINVPVFILSAGVLKFINLISIL